MWWWRSEEPTPLPLCGSGVRICFLSPLYNALFIALNFLCTMRYLSLSISFVQCVIYRFLSPLYNALLSLGSARKTSTPPRRGSTLTTSTLRGSTLPTSTPRGSTPPTIHSPAASIYSLPFLHIHFLSVVRNTLLHRYHYFLSLSLRVKPSASSLPVSKRPPLPQLPSY